MSNAFNRALRFFIRSSFWVSLAGILIDLDHWYALQVGWDARWAHHLLYENRLVLVAYCIIWGSVCFSFTAGWFDELE